MAKATSTKGLMTFMSKADPGPTVLVPTAISKAAPAALTVVGATVTEGDPIYCENTGFPELDGKWFAAGVSTATSIPLLGSDTTGSAGVLASAPIVNAYEAADGVQLCLSAVNPAPTDPGVVSVGTFCDPSASVPGEPSTAGTMTLSGFVNVADAGYAELLLAQDDGIERAFSVVLPKDQGYIIIGATLSQITWDLPLSGGIGFTCNGALSTKPRHCF